MRIRIRLVRIKAQTLEKVPKIGWYFIHFGSSSANWCGSGSGSSFSLWCEPGSGSTTLLQQKHTLKPLSPTFLLSGVSEWCKTIVTTSPSGFPRVSGILVQVVVYNVLVFTMKKCSISIGFLRRLNNNCNKMLQGCACEEEVWEEQARCCRVLQGTVPV